MPAAPRPDALKSALIALLLVMAGATAPSDAVLAAPAGSVTSTVGVVQLHRFGAASTSGLQIGAGLDEGDTIMTGPSGRVRISLGDDTIIQLGSSSELRLDWLLADASQGLVQRQVTLIKGIVRTVVEAISSRVFFEQRTPTAIASVRGTDWITEASQDTTATLVLGGVVAVSSPDAGGEIVLTDGEGTTINAGAAPSAAAAWGQARIDRFIASTDLP